MSTPTAILALKIVGDGTDAAKALDTTADKSSKFAQKAQAAGKVAGKVLAVGLLAVGAAALSATKAAAEDEAGATRLAQTLQKAAGATSDQVAATEDWIAAQGKAVGVSDDELRPALSSLVSVTKDVDEAQRLASLAMDISAAKGISLESVAKKLAKAQTNGAASLATLGVQTKDAEGKTLSLEAVQRKLADTYSGEAAKSAKTAAGQQKILSVRMGELQEEIGAKLLPVMGKLVEVGLKVVDWISQNQTVAGILLGTLGGLLATVYLVSKAMQAWAAVTKIATAVQALFNAETKANPLALVAIALIALGVALVIAYKKSETFRKIVDAAFRVVKKAVGGVVDVVGSLVGWVRDKLPAAFKSAKAIVGGAVKVMTAPVRTLLDIVGKVSTFVRDDVPAAFSAAKAAVLSPVNTVIGKVGDVIDKVKDLIGWVRDKVGGAFTTMLGIATGPLDAVASGVDWLVGLVEKLVGWIDDIDWPDPPGWVSDLWNAGSGIFGAAGPSLPEDGGFDPTGRDLRVVNIKVEGAVDSWSSAKQIRDLLTRESTWSGRVVIR